jgi:hypothetical protein
MVNCPRRFWEISNSLKKRGSKVHISKKFQFSKHFKPRHLENWQGTDPLGKSPTFLFSYKRDRQLTLKFDMAIDVLSIYRLIARKFGLLGWIAVFDTTPISRFWGRLLVAFTDVYDMKMHCSRYHSIDMHCIMLPVKFDDGLSISVLENKQLYKKNGSQNFTLSKSYWFFNFQTPPFEERTDLGKSLAFLELIFLVNKMDNPTSNLS